MRAVRFVLLLAAALGVHFIGGRLVPGFASALDPFLVVLVFQALDGGSLAGLVCGLLVGAAQDAVTRGFYGLHGFADTVVGYAAAIVAQRVVIQRWGGVMLAFVAGSAVQQLLLVLVALLVLGDPELPSLASVVVKPLLNALAGLGLFVGTQRGRVQYERWRRNRSAKIHFQ